MGNRAVTLMLTLSCAACATPKMRLETDSPTASIFLEESGTTPSKRRVIGKGNADVELPSEGIRQVTVESSQTERVHVMLLDGRNPPSRIALQLPARAVAESAQSADSEEDEISEEMQAMVRDLIQVQRYLTAGDPKRADTALAPILLTPSKKIPASAYTLKAKILMTKGDSTGAKAALETALATFPEETEARALLQTLRKMGP